MEMETEVQELIPAENRVVMVSGANRGIGKAIGQRLHRDGYILSLGARDVTTLKDDWTTSPERVMCHQFDAKQPDLAREWVAATVSQFGRLDGLVNVAGILLEANFQDDEDTLDELLAVNLKAPYRLISHALPHLKKTGQGRIINVASLSGLRYIGGSAGYTISKFALVGLSHAARFAGWDMGVRVTALCPGSVNTDMGIGDDISPMMPEEMIQPETLATVVSLILSLPNNASVAYLPVNARLESTV
jgi:NAD(P)-dependent dehydrogenase (short-subunit alcohol dehydrogenase family)